MDVYFPVSLLSKLLLRYAPWCLVTGVLCTHLPEVPKLPKRCGLRSGSIKVTGTSLACLVSRNSEFCAIGSGGKSPVLEAGPPSSSPAPLQTSWAILDGRLDHVELHVSHL